MQRIPAARTRTRSRHALLALIAFALLIQPAQSKQFELDFDGPEASWQVRCRENEARLELHTRRREGARNERAEFIRVQVGKDNTPLRLEHRVPAVRVLDELTATLWLRSDRPGSVLAMRVSFRDTQDPATGAPLSMIIQGDKYESEGKWQKLTCRTSDKVVKDQLRQLRARKNVVVDPNTMYVDQVILGCQLGPGFVEMMIEDLSLGPIVPMENIELASAAANGSATLPEMKAAPMTTMDEPTKSPVPVAFNLHRMRVDGKPFFPRVVPYRQERPEVLADAGFNSTWVADYESLANTGRFRERGIWLTATPPFAKGASGEPLDSDDASLLPFPSTSSSVLFWMLGARLPGNSRPRLASWANQIRDADRSFKRPLAADVADDERIASRHLDMVGLSRHVLHTGLSLADYRDEMIRRRDRAWPGTFIFTWIQTEPAPELMDLKQVTDETPILEPEQIRLQVYAALAAGCRGIGFWTTTPLDSDAPGARERLLTLTQLNMELSLLEPWLATGSSVQLIPFTVDTKKQTHKPATQSKPGAQPGKKSLEAIEEERRKEREFSAALIRTEGGALLLPMWLDERSQYVPGELAGYSATIVVPGGGDTATAWEITTTGRILNLNRENGAGGLKITLPHFDQTAAILVTADTAVAERMNQRVAAIQERSAAATVELSRLKLERVRQVEDHLNHLGLRLSQAVERLGEAKLQSDKAETALKLQQFHTARQHACRAMQNVRIVQRARFDDAVAKLSSPMVSPLAACFQTLPAHWRVMRSAGMSEARGATRSLNLLPSGEFEDLDTLIAAGWQRHEQTELTDVYRTAELKAIARQGKQSLRLAVQPKSAEPSEFEFHAPALSMVSPSVSVHAGQLVMVSGWVKTLHAIPKSTDGLLIYDSLMGKTGAVRITNSAEWQRFEMWRPVPESQSMTLNVEMHGLGEVLIDDLQITSSALPADVAESPRPQAPPIKPANHSAFERFDIRRLAPVKRRPDR